MLFLREEDDLQETTELGGETLVWCRESARVIRKPPLDAKWARMQFDEKQSGVSAGVVGRMQRAVQCTSTVSGSLAQGGNVDKNTEKFLELRGGGIRKRRDRCEGMKFCAFFRAQPKCEAPTSAASLEEKKRERYRAASNAQRSLSLAEILKTLPKKERWIVGTTVFKARKGLPDRDDRWVGADPNESHGQVVLRLDATCFSESKQKGWKVLGILNSMILFSGCAATAKVVCVVQQVGEPLNNIIETIIVVNNNNYKNNVNSS